MQRYMKSEMPYLGVPTPVHRRVSRAVFDAHPLADAVAWRDTVRALWDDATHREERYAAITLSGHRLYDAHQRMGVLPLYAHMIVTGAWWDYIDAIAPKRLGLLLRRHPKSMSSKMRAWSKGQNMWKRRSAIICQLNFKEDTDETLLLDCITPSMASPEFFLRKGIGWALRQHAYTNPAAVIAFVRRHRDSLSPLSKREALRNLLEAGRIAAIP